MKYSNLDIEEYHKSSGISFTGLSQFGDDCPIRYKKWKDGVTGISIKNAKSGNLAHTAVLEPEKFDQRYIKIPEFEKDIRRDDGSKYDKPTSTTAYKNKVKEFEKENVGKKILTVAEYDDAMYTAEALRNHRQVTELLLPEGEFETSFIWEDLVGIHADTISRCYLCGGENECHWLDNIVTCIHCDNNYNKEAVLLRTRPDYFYGNVCIDLKTSESSKEYAFKNSIDFYHYDAQASLQIDGLAKHGTVIDEYYWIAVEKKTHIVQVFKAHENLLIRGKQKIDKWLQKYKWCFDNNCYPGYEQIIVVGE